MKFSLTSIVYFSLACASFFRCSSHRNLCCLFKMASKEAEQRMVKEKEVKSKESTSGASADEKNRSSSRSVREWINKILQVQQIESDLRTPVAWIELSCWKFRVRDSQFRKAKSPELAKRLLFRFSRMQPNRSTRSTNPMEWNCELHFMSMNWTECRFSVELSSSAQELSFHTRCAKRRPKNCMISTESIFSTLAVVVLCRSRPTNAIDDDPLQQYPSSNVCRYLPMSSWRHFCIARKRERK